MIYSEKLGSGGKPPHIRSGGNIGELCKGIVIGIANILPGISGGMLAVSMGVYDKIIHAVTRLFQEPKKSMRTLFPYAVGIVIGTIGLSFAFEYLFGMFPFQTKMAFIGLIAGGLPSLFLNAGWKEGTVRKKKLVLPFITFVLVVGGTALVTAFIGEQGTQSVNSLEMAAGVLSGSGIWYLALFSLGILMAGTMVIPGVSGSMLLMMLGYYESILILTNACIRYAVSLHLAVFWEYGKLLLPYFAGMVIGVFLFAKVVEYFLEKRRRQMYSVIIGMVCSSPFVILWDISWGSLELYEVLTGISLCLIGYVAASLCGGEGAAQRDTGMHREAKNT